LLVNLTFFDQVFKRARFLLLSVHEGELTSVVERRKKSSFGKMKFRREVDSIILQPIVDFATKYVRIGARY
jgi:hypothetical protein